MAVLRLLVLALESNGYKMVLQKQFMLKELKKASQKQ
jgi:hypothetical protein